MKWSWNKKNNDSINMNATNKDEELRQCKIKELRKTKAINIKNSRNDIKRIELKNKKIIDEFDLKNISIRANKWGDWLVISYFDVDVFMKSLVDITSVPGEKKYLGRNKDYRSYDDNDMPFELYHYSILRAETPTYIKFHLSTGRGVWLGVPLEIGEVVFEAVNSLWKSNRELK